MDVARWIWLRRYDLTGTISRMRRNVKGNAALDGLHAS